MTLKSENLDVIALQAELKGLKPKARNEVLRAMRELLHLAKRHQNKPEVELRFRLQNESFRRERRQRLLDQCEPSDEAAKRLKCDLNTLRVWISRRRILSLKEGGRNMIPVWQYDGGSPTGLLPGLENLLGALDGLETSEAKADWLSNLDLGEGLSPIEALRTKKQTLEQLCSLAFDHALSGDKRREGGK